MIEVLKIGHAEFAVRDLSRMCDYYRDVIGLAVTERREDVAYLSTTVDHHAIVLRQGGETRLTRLAFQVAPAETRDLVGHLAAHGLPAETRTDDEPGIDRLVRTQNPDGVAVDLYADFETRTHAGSRCGVAPLKLSHVAALCPDVERTRRFYADALGFRFSDAIGDFFYFLRCGADHHTINLISGKRAGLQHVAFELDDAVHVGSSADVLARHGVETLWGPLRHGAGHNLALYHLDPEGQIVEFCAELDRMSNEGLGYFDPRPWHEDRPQRPKRWTDPRAGAVVWGQFPPPERFGVGVKAG